MGKLWKQIKSSMSILELRQMQRAIPFVSQNFWVCVSGFFWVALLFFLHFGIISACDCKTQKNPENTEKPRILQTQSFWDVKEQARGDRTGLVSSFSMEDGSNPLGEGSNSNFGSLFLLFFFVCGSTSKLHVIHYGWWPWQFKRFSK